MVAAIAEVTEACEEPQLDWKTVASSDHVGPTWFMRRHGARMVHLQHLQEHRVHEQFDLPQGVKPLSVRWVDKDDYSKNQSETHCQRLRAGADGARELLQCDTAAGYVAYTAGGGTVVGGWP